MAREVLTITTEPFPINLVEIIRLKNSTRHNTNTGRCLDFNIDTAEKYVFSSGNCRSLTQRINLEKGTSVVMFDRCSSKRCECITGTLAEITVDCFFSKGGIGRAGC